ncbi:divalent-cation tolerance protein CutA [Omnitrophica bacterium]|nr:divalent-cation tolerance protein CutA [Candidatus Omnitrophota bacterium]
MEAFLLVLSTAPNRREARKLAQLLVRQRLVACVNLIDKAESIYWWQSKIQSSREVLLLMKTRQSCYKELEKTLKKHHSYDVPEVVAIPLAAGSSDYLKWLAAETR